MNEDKYTILTGFLDVGNGHKIYYQEWGNKSAKPIFFLHGGPGGALKDGYKINFDPKVHHIIFHNQRGAGQSTPFASIEHNTTQDLIEDIEKLRKNLNFNKIQLTGGSWGSFLALAYGVTYPDNVEKILIGGIFTGTKSEQDYIQQGGLKTHYPEAWENYIKIVPNEMRSNTTKYYLDKMLNGTKKEQDDHVRRWVLLESSAMSIDSDYTKELLNTKDYDDVSRSLAIIEAHYFVNNCFVDDNFIYKNSSKLKDIPIVMIHGRYDHVCPPRTAYKIADKIGNNCHLQIVPSSHANEGALREVLRAYIWSFLG